MRILFQNIVFVMQRSPLALLLALVLLSGCRGMDSDREPIHLNLNMDYQPRYYPMGASSFFEDGRMMRPPVPGTVARGLLREDADFYSGRTEAGGFVTENPIPLSMDVIERGQERYNIYCSVCHSPSGDGRGIIMTGQYGYTPAPSFHDDRLRDVEDGYLYDVLTNGIRNMPGYGTQIAVADRWAIVAYMRALQRSQDAALSDVPEDQRGGIQVGEAPPEEPVGPDVEGAENGEQDAGEAADTINAE